MPEITEIEVRFDTWCPRCIHGPRKETLDPCNDCLDYPVNDSTTKPVRFIEKEKKA